MAKNAIDSEIRDRIESFLEELSQLVKASALEAVQEVLGEGAGGAPARRATKKRATKKRATKKRATKKRATKKRGTKARASKGTGRRGRPRRQSEAVLARLTKRISQFVSSNPGSRLEEMSKALSIPSKDLKRPVADMMDAKMLRKTGAKRGTKYFAK